VTQLDEASSTSRFCNSLALLVDFPCPSGFLNLSFGQIVTKGLENLPESGPVVLAPKQCIPTDVILKKRSLISDQYPASIDIRGTFFSAST